jgi:DivIVA domain-containing protein
MEWFIAAVAVVALGVAAIVAAGGGGSMPKDPVRDTYAMTLSEDPLDGEAVRGLRFGVALRGYAMDQVDAVLDRLSTELDARDARVAELEARLAERGAVPGAGSGAGSPGPDALTPPDPVSRVWEQPR